MMFSIPVVFPELGLLLEHLLQVRPVDRPCVDTVLEHAWFSDGTDLASEIDRLTQQVNMRTDGRTFPLVSYTKDGELIRQLSSKS